MAQTEESSGRDVKQWLLAVLALVAAVAAMKVAYVVLMPLTAAFFLAVLIRPLQRWLHTHLPRRLDFLSLILSFLAVLAVLAIGVGLIYLAVETVVSRAPEFGQQFKQYLEGLSQWAQGHGIHIRGDITKAEGTLGRLASLATAFISSASSVLAIGALIFFYAVLMLVELGQWRSKAATALAGEQSQVLLDAMEAISDRVRKYIVTQTLISAASGVTEGLYLWVVGVEFAFTWGLLFFLFNFIPNVGSLVVAVAASLTALIQFGFWPALAITGGIVLLEQVLGNLIGPRLQGSALKVSPLVLLWSIIFWSWVWGIAGALLATPLAVTIVLICEYVRPLRPLALMLHEKVSPDQYQLNGQGKANKPQGPRDKPPDGPERPAAQEPTDRPGLAPPPEPSPWPT